jgi:hypothetical protein
MKVNQVKVTWLRKLQESGVDFSKDYFAQPDSKLQMIRQACRELHYSQSPNAKAMGRTRWQSFYYSMQNLAEKLNK